MATVPFEVIAMMLLLRLGQVMLQCGSVRSKNAATAAVRGTMDLAIAVLSLWAIGQAFDPWDTLQAGHPVFSAANVFGMGGMLGFRAWGPGVLIAGGAVMSAAAERTRFTPLAVLTAVFAAALVPLAAEFAVFTTNTPTIMAQGIGLAAVAGGVAGLTIAKIAGARKGKFNRDLSANLVPGHNVVLQIAGLLLIAAGLSPVGGLPLILGLSAAVLSSAAYGRIKFSAPDVPLLVAGGLGGIIAATTLLAAPDVGKSLLGGGGATAVLAGALAGVLTPMTIVWLENRWRIDDVAGVAAASVVGGIVGPLVGVLLQWPASFGRYAAGLGRLAAVWLGAMVAAGAVAWLIARLFGRRNALRLDETAEYEGMDLAVLNLNAYPDFQQTMIKSHHLRQL